MAWFTPCKDASTWKPPGPPPAAVLVAGLYAHPCRGANLQSTAGRIVHKPLPTLKSDMQKSLAAVAHPRELRLPWLG